MKKKLFAVLALAMILALCSSAALAVSGDITVKDAKAYADAAMTQYIGTIPKGTSLLVRAYDSYADVYVGGKIVYINKNTLLDDDITGPYNATLKKGTVVFQRASTSASTVRLKKSCVVNVCGINGSWALVRATDSRGAFAFVKLNKLTKIQIAN